MQKETHNLNSGLYNIDTSCPFLCYISFQTGAVIMRTRMVFEYGPQHTDGRCLGTYLLYQRDARAST